MAKAEILFRMIRKWEGGWSDHKNDKGGKTNMGTQVQLASAKIAICLKNSSFGVEKLSFFLGRRFNFLPTFLI